MDECGGVFGGCVSWGMNKVEIKNKKDKEALRLVLRREGYYGDLVFC